MKRLVSVIIFILFTTMFFANIKNPDKPLKGEWDFKLKRVWIIKSAGGEEFANPRQLLVSGDGTIYVYDDKRLKFYILDPDGKNINTFGKKGEGPGEIQQMEQTQLFLVKNKLIAIDGARLHYFTREGKYINSVVNTGPQRPTFFINENEYISSPIFINLNAPDSEGKIKHYNIKTKQEKVISEFSLFNKGYVETPAGRRTIVVVGITPMMVNGYDGSKIYFGKNDSFEINVVDLKGKKYNSFGIKREKEKYPEEPLRQRFNELASKPSKEMVDSIIKSLPREYTFFNRIEVYNDLIYVFIPDLDDKNPRKLDIFSAEGKYLYRGYLSFGKNMSALLSPLHTLIIKNGYLYIALENEEGEIFIAKYKINLPKKNRRG